MTPRTIAIIGSAVAGPTLALQILRHPVLSAAFTPVLYDRTAKPGTRSVKETAGATVGLFGNGLYPLLQLGLGDAIAQHGYEYHALSTWAAPANGPLQQLSHHDRSFYSPSLMRGVIFFERQALQALLVDAVRASGGEVHWNKQASLFESSESTTRIMFTDGSTAKAHLLVGADGGYSTVRRHILRQTLGNDEKLVAERWLPDYMGLTGVFGVSSALAAPNAWAPFSDAHIFWMDPGFIATGPCPNGMRRFDMCVPENEPPPHRRPDAPTRLDADAENWQHALVPSAYGWHDTVALLRKYACIGNPYTGTFGDLLAGSNRIIRSPLRQRVWESHEISGAGAVCIGDAARLLLPTSGQGTGFAIEDATFLAKALLESATNGGSLSDAASKYATMRVPRGKTMAAVTRFSTRWGMGETWTWRTIRNFASRWQATTQDVWPFNARIHL